MEYICILLDREPQATAHGSEVKLSLPLSIEVFARMTLGQVSSVPKCLRLEMVV